MFDNYIFHIKALVNFGVGLSIAGFIFYLFHFLTNDFIKNHNNWLKPITFRNNQIISKQLVVLIFLNSMRALKWVLILGVIYLMIPFVLKELPYSHDYAINLMHSIHEDLISVGKSLLGFFPNLFFILVILLITRFIIRGLKFIFSKITKENIVIEGFYPEWSHTTFQLIRLVILLFSMVLIYPYLPGAGTKALEGMSIFLGVIISLGSSSAIANLLAGVMISYMRAFKEGD